MKDSFKPPVLICTLVAVATLLGCGVWVWLRQTQQASSGTTAAISNSHKDLSQLIELNQIYSKPPQPEDPSKYKRIPKNGSRGPADPAKNAE